MAMVNCHECRISVSNKAKRCPHCEIADPAPGTAVLRAVVAGLVLAAFVPVLSQCGNKPTTTNASAVPNATLEKAQWLQKFGNDPKALDQRFGDDAQTACSAGVNDYLRSIAAHDYGWDSDVEGLFGTKFNKISTTSAGMGLLTLKSTRAKLSNGFGAFQHIDVYCLYDVNKGEMVKYSQNNPATEVGVEAENAPIESSNAAGSDDNTF